jgi:hypothetical protein
LGDEHAGGSGAGVVVAGATVVVGTVVVGAAVVLGAGPSASKHHILSSIVLFQQQLCSSHSFCVVISWFLHPVLSATFKHTSDNSLVGHQNPRQVDSQAALSLRHISSAGFAHAVQPQSFSVWFPQP